MQASLFSPEPAPTADHSAPREGATHQAEQDVGESAVVVTSLSAAIEAGQQGMAISLEHAEQRDPGFTGRAAEAFIRFLGAAPGRQMPGEDLVEMAKRHGIVPPNGDRAFGGVFLSLSRRNVIRCLRSDLPRKRGHGCSGGKLWALVQ